MPKIQRGQAPIVRREGNHAVIYLPLDQEVNRAWVEVFSHRAGQVNFEGFEVSVVNKLPGVPGGTAAVAKLDLAGAGGTDLSGRVTGAVQQLAFLVEEVDAEDRRRDGITAEIERVAKAWWDAIPNK